MLEAKCSQYSEFKNTRLTNISIIGMGEWSV